MTTFTFGDDLEFADLSDLEPMVAHLFWCDPLLKALSLGMKALDLAGTTVPVAALFAALAGGGLTLEFWRKSACTDVPFGRIQAVLAHLVAGLTTTSP